MARLKAWDQPDQVRLSLNCPIQSSRDVKSIIVGPRRELGPMRAYLLGMYASWRRWVVRHRGACNEQTDSSSIDSNSWGFESHGGVPQPISRPSNVQHPLSDNLVMYPTCQRKCNCQTLEERIQLLVPCRAREAMNLYIHCHLDHLSLCPSGRLSCGLVVV